MLLSAEIARVQGNPDAVQAACRRAYGLMEADGASTWDFRVLDPWVRVNICLGNEQAAGIAVKRLEKIGYNDLVYRHFISTHQGGKNYEKPRNS